MSADFETSKKLFLQGLDRYQAGAFADAEVSFAASLALVPGRVSTLTNLGAARLKQGKPAEALDPLEQALAQEPDNLDACGHRATALAELGRHEEALRGVEHALRLDATGGHAWSLRGRLLKELGRTGEASAAFETAIGYGADPELNRYFLAALSGRDSPGAPPRDYVEPLFDGYADQFDEHLRALNYRAPRVLVDKLVAMRRRFASALDLGCGTGLCGPSLKPLAERLVGVDLSARMLAGAQALGLYDALVQDDLAHHLGTTGDRHDLLLAADVFIYVGALEPVFDGVARVICSGGVFCFSVEEPAVSNGHQDFALQSSLRYAHSERYIRDLAAHHGLTVEHCLRAPIRDDRGAPVAGRYFWLLKL